jgi:hypothetical protein
MTVDVRESVTSLWTVGGGGQRDGGSARWSEQNDRVMPKKRVRTEDDAWRMEDGGWRVEDGGAWE